MIYMGVPSMAKTEKKISDEFGLRVMIEVEKNNHLNQRAIAKKLDVSLGKLNYCMQELVKVGYIKLNNFSNSKNKLQYLYLLTPKGIAAKTSLVSKFLKIRLDEYNKLKEHL
jgi:EPS-associated MarR family transcriptional regulator